jgi:hypothetical protein
MNKTYQPFILAKADEILEILKEDIKYSDYIKNRLCNILTQKFIKGDLNVDDPVDTIFDDEDDLHRFISEALCYEDLSHLTELGLVGFLDEDDERGHFFFITEKGKEYMAKMGI